jgi:hypothetical protein
MFTGLPLVYFPRTAKQTKEITSHHLPFQFVSTSSDDYDPQTRTQPSLTMDALFPTMNAQHQSGDEQRLATLREALWTLAYECRALYNDNLGLCPAVVLDYLQCLGTGSVDDGAADMGGQSQTRVEVRHQAIHELATEVAVSQI